MSSFGHPLPGERWVYSAHCLVRLEERRITKAEVEKVISDPLIVEFDDADPSGFVLTRTIAGRTIAVVIVPEGGDWLVVTAWVVD